jgi:NAD(P)-dependent dehydrogenase (short-subunit alcohol dehydrogenase family)
MNPSNQMNKTALVSGGSRGIGLGISMELARTGYDLVVNGVREEKEVKGPLGQLSSLGTEVHYVKGDLSDTLERQELYEKAVSLLGHLNLLVNNAGVAPLVRSDILETSEESYDRVMGINLKGAFFLTQKVAGHMISQKKADPGYQALIINISSVSATVASTNRGEYCISKAGLSMVTRLWAVRLGEYGIPVFEIQPGIIETDMTGAVKERYTKQINDGLCLQKRWGTPEDVGKVVVAMASGTMSYSTGQVVMVDGGMTIPRL